MNIVKIALIIGLWILAGWYVQNHFFVDKSEYSGYFYPDKENLDNSIETGKFDSLEACRQGVSNLMKYHRTNKPEEFSAEESQSMRNFILRLGEAPINTSESSTAYNVFTALGKVGFDTTTGDYISTYTEPDGECGYKCRYDSAIRLHVCEETYGLDS